MGVGCGGQPVHLLRVANKAEAIAPMPRHSNNLSSNLELFSTLHARLPAVTHQEISAGVW